MGNIPMFVTAAKHSFNVEIRFDSSQFLFDGTSCVDVCDNDVKTTCASANKAACSAGTTTCGGCLTGFKASGDSCVDVCDAAVQNGCSSVNKAACSAGTTTCGGLLRNWSFTVLLVIKTIRSATNCISPVTEAVLYSATRNRTDNETYGKQRMLSSIAWGSGALFVGFMIVMHLKVQRNVQIVDWECTKTRLNK